MELLRGRDKISARASRLLLFLDPPFEILHPPLCITYTPLSPTLPLSPYLLSFSTTYNDTLQCTQWEGSVPLSYTLRSISLNIWCCLLLVLIFISEVKRVAKGSAINSILCIEAIIIYMIVQPCVQVQWLRRNL